MSRSRAGPGAAATVDSLERVAGALSPPDPEAALHAGRAALCLAVDPVGLGGAVVAGGAGCAGLRAWLRTLREASGREVTRLPPGVASEALVESVDLVASAAARRVVRSDGLLDRAVDGLLVAPLAEDLGRAPAAVLASALDRGQVTAVLLDEGREAPGTPPSLLDRVAFHLAVSPRWRPDGGLPPTVLSPSEARSALASVVLPPELERALVGAALEFGIRSLRPAVFAVRAARALAALDGRRQVDEEDVRRAAELVLAPRATAPGGEKTDPGETERRERDDRQQRADGDRAGSEPSPDAGEEPESRSTRDGPARPPEEDETARAGGPEETGVRERLVEAIAVRLPELEFASGRASGAAGSGRGDGELRASRRGRRVGSRPGRPPDDGPLDLAATVRAAAPWQRIRRDEDDGEGGPALRLRPRDLRVEVRVREPATTTVFVVDASGSQAMRRLGETKGAVELLLSRSYARRDRVALVAFRGRRAEVLLPPTRALARARRELTGLAGGGGTPLASGLREGRRVVERVLREGDRAALVLLTDGGANVTRDGEGDRSKAAAEALKEARALPGLGAVCAVLDTSARGRRSVRELSEALGGSYRHLPRPTARGVGEAARATLEVEQGTT